MHGMNIKVEVISSFLKFC